MDAAINCVVRVLNDKPLVVDILTIDHSSSLVEQMAAIYDLWDR